MGIAPRLLKPLDVLVGGIGIAKLPISADATHVAEGEVGDLAGLARRVFRKAHAQAKNGVRIVAARVEVGPELELRTLAGEPRQHPALDAAEVRGDEPVPRCRYDCRAGDAADDRERIVVVLFDPLVVAGRNELDRRRQVEPIRLFQVLRLHAVGSPPPRSRPVIFERSANTVAVAGLCEHG